MKKSLSMLMALLLLLPFIALGEPTITVKPVQEGAFNKAVFEASALYEYDKFTKSWVVGGAWEKEYSNMIYSVYIVLYDKYVEQGVGPAMAAAFFDRVENYYNPVTALRILVDGTVYSFEKLEPGDSVYAFVNATNVLKAFTESLIGAKEVSFQFVTTDKYGRIMTYTEDIPIISSLNQLVEMSELLEKSNAWSIVSENYMAAADEYYGAKIE